MSTLPPRRERSSGRVRLRTSSAESSTSALLFAGSVVARSLVLAALAATALLVALAAWFGLKSALRIDPVIGRERVWLQYGQFRPPYAIVRLEDGKYSVPGRVYDVSVEASVPVNENNLELGNFMVAVSLLDGAGNRVVNASRPALLSPTECVPRPAPAASKSLFHLPSLFTLPLSFLPLPRTPSLFAFSSILPSPCAPLQTLNIPILESTSFVSPIPSSSLGWVRRRRATRTLRGAGPVKSVWVEIGRKDAYPHHEAFDLTEAGEGHVDEQEAVARRVGENSRQGERKIRELQVHESWLRIEVKPTALRSLVYYHPYISFFFFVPSFLLFEALAALAVWAWWVATSGASRPASSTPQADWWTHQGNSKAAESEKEEEVKPLLTPSEVTTEGEDAGERAKRIRMRLGRGGVGMSAFGTEGEEEELESVGGGISDREETEDGGRARVKEEDREEPAFGETGTLAGSATTRRTASIFGPSLAPTTATTASSRTTGLSSAGLRGRTTAGG
ncbi:adipose-regulatory protein, Seipin family protein [Rhodotorula toruloides]|uniref:Adipose-regulatory protein, Seipin family protein n=1 Tax=Rhodotorula toruloides TaxID=5286 RepID=A0A511KKQ6_RHOTO|nr:adipose-regulatory protein, Seipin family protein [Rhodotorula toruloides]